MNIKDRFCDLATRAEEKYCTTFSDFLNIEEQSELKSLKLSVPVATFGGYENAERVVAGFGENAENEPFPISIIKAEPSLRVDAVLAGVYNISRSATKGLFAEGKVFVNSSQCENTSLTLKPCDIVSVRGHGRFGFLGVVRQTKKGKLVLNIKLYK